MTTPITLDVVSDVVCPWCYIGKHRLEQARALLAADATMPLALELRWRPYELNPDLPPDGLDRRSYCERKFGSLEYANQLYARVAAAAAADSLPLAWQRIARTPNTRAAHRLIELAGRYGVQDALVDALFQAYFVDGRDVGAREVLLELAVAAGLDPVAAATALDDDVAIGPTVTAALADAHELGITGVPAFVYHGRVLFSGAQDPRTIALALTRAVARGL